MCVVYACHVCVWCVLYGNKVLEVGYLNVMLLMTGVMGTCVFFTRKEMGGCGGDERLPSFSML